MPRNETLVKTHIADAAIAAYRIVKHGDSDGDVAQNAAATTPGIGISGRVAAAAAGDRIDIVRAGIAEVEYGGTVTRGAMLVADADGKAVVSTTANDQAIGLAEVAGVDGDIGSVLISPFNI